MYLVNPPGIVSLMWQITKHIVDSKTQTRINFITKPEDLENFLPKEVFFKLKKSLTFFNIFFSEKIKT